MTVISDRVQITPEWLTDVLRRSDILANGEVIAIETSPNPAFNSVVLHLKITFSYGASPSIPHRLVLKRNLKESWAVPAGIREVEFYQTVALLADHPAMIVPFYDAAFDALTGDSSILLLDLSDTHVIPVTRERQLESGNNLPSEEHLAQAIDALARFHAYWWENPRLGTGVAQIGTWMSDEEHFAREVERRQAAWNDLRDKELWFPPALAALYESILNEYFSLWEQYTKPRLPSFSRLTLTHGDAYLANFFCPREGVSGGAYLFDWQSPEVNRGTGDLANMCATFWTREQRAENDREQKALRRYLDVLQENGVTNYSWDNLVTDYQYSLIDWLLIPLQDRLDGAGKAYWLPKMQCLAEAFEDWNGDELFSDKKRTP